MILKLGLDAQQCVEKADLVALLVDSAAGNKGSPRSQRRSSHPRSPCSRGFARRVSRSRKSILRGSPTIPNTGEPSSRLLAVSRELQRVLRARSYHDVLGLQGTAGSPESRTAVLQRYRELCKVVHPDKCPASLALLSAEAFQKLEAAKESALKATLKSSCGNGKDKSSKPFFSPRTQVQTKHGGR